MVEVNVCSHLRTGEGEIYYVDRIGKFGSQTYICETLGKAFQKVAELVQMENVLTIVVWN